MTSFDLLMPQTLPEALKLLADGAPDIAPLAGGTNLIVDIRGGRHCPKTLMDLSGLSELRGIRRDDGHLVIGSSTTITELLEDTLIAEHAPILREATAVFANPLVRNRATIGGNLCDASPAADTAPPLLVLGAEVELASQAGTRRVPLDEFFVHVRETTRQPQELLTTVYIPMTPHSAGGFRKMGLRKADAIAVLSAAVLVERDGDGKCKRARIALGAVAPTPIRVPAAEELLCGQQLTPKVIAEAARLAAEAAKPIDDVRGAAAYRRRVVSVLVRRLFTEARDEKGDREGR